MSRSRLYPLIYLVWIAACGLAFVALSPAEDPSRRRDALIRNDASRLALEALRRSDPGRFREYEAVHAARDGERWIVLCDRVPHTALREAIVVELRSRDGTVILFRKPVRNDER